MKKMQSNDIVANIKIEMYNPLELFLRCSQLEATKLIIGKLIKIILPIKMINSTALDFNLLIEEHKKQEHIEAVPTQQQHVAHNLHILIKLLFIKEF